MQTLWEFVQLDGFVYHHLHGTQPIGIQLHRTAVWANLRPPCAKNLPPIRAVPGLAKLLAAPVSRAEEELRTTTPSQ